MFRFGVSPPSKSLRHYFGWPLTFLSFSHRHATFAVSSRARGKVRVAGSSIPPFRDKASVLIRKLK